MGNFLNPDPPKSPSHFDEEAADVSALEAERFVTNRTRGSIARSGGQGRIADQLSRMGGLGSEAMRRLADKHKRDSRGIARGVRSRGSEFGLSGESRGQLDNVVDASIRGGLTDRTRRLQDDQDVRQRADLTSLFQNTVNQNLLRVIGANQEGIEPRAPKRSFGDKFLGGVNDFFDRLTG